MQYFEGLVNSYLIKKIGKVSHRHCGIKWIDQSGTSEEWTAWDNKAREQYPKIMKLADIGEWIDDLLGDIARIFWKTPKGYIRCRFLSKTHYINCGLKKGVWHEPKERLLHSIMSECVRFIDGSDDNSIQRAVLEYVRTGVHTSGEDWGNSDSVEWYLDSCKQLSPLCEAYIWYKEVFPSYAIRESALYDRVSMGDLIGLGKEVPSKEAKEKNEKEWEIVRPLLTELEEETEKAEVDNCQKVVSCLRYLYD